MVLKRVLDFSKLLAKEVLRPGDIAIDGTTGNGHDTVFLAQCVGESGTVYGFDIQALAIERTRRRLQEAHIENVKLIADGHEHLDRYIAPEHRGHIRCAMFNLGYLPHSDKQITTTGKTTIAAIQALFPLLAPHGLIILVVYTGHAEGKKEKEDLLAYLKTLDQRKAQVLCYRFINQKNDAPFVLAIEKLRDEA